MAHIHGNINLKLSTEQKTSGDINLGFRCLCTNPQSVGNKQEEPELLIWKGDHNLIGITETWD